MLHFLTSDGFWKELNRCISSEMRSIAAESWMANTSASSPLLLQIEKRLAASLVIKAEAKRVVSLGVSVVEVLPNRGSSERLCNARLPATTQGLPVVLISPILRSQ